MQSQSLVTDNRKDFKDEVKQLTQASIEDKRQNDGLMQVNPSREETRKE